MFSRSLLIMAVVGLFSPAQADTIFVDVNCPGGDGSELDPYCSIQTAIDNAGGTATIINCTFVGNHARPLSRARALAAQRLPTEVLPSDVTSGKQELQGSERVDS